MGFRFQRRIKLLPGVTMNLGKTSSSFSFGTRGAHVTLGKNGIRKTIGIPGTGLSYSTYDRYSGRDASSGTQSKKRTEASCNNINVGFFSRLFLSNEEKGFLDGIKLLLNGKHDEAILKLSSLINVADACFTSGILLAGDGKYNDAMDMLLKAEKHAIDLGILYAKYSIQIGLSFPITNYLSIELTPSLQALLLVKASFLKQTGQTSDACNLLIDLYRQDKSNLLTLISLLDLILDTPNPGEKWLKSLLIMTENIANDTPVHTLLLYYRAMVLSELHYYDAALSLLSTIGRKKTERSHELITAMAYLKAEILEIQGKKKQAKVIWEKIYAENPSDSFASQKLIALK